MFISLQKGFTFDLSKVSTLKCGDYNISGDINGVSYTLYAIYKGASFFKKSQCKQVYDLLCLLKEVVDATKDPVKTLVEIMETLQYDKDYDDIDAEPGD
jgi:hypothetical protein